MNLFQILNQSAMHLRNASEKTLRQTYSFLRSRLNSRISTFAKHDALSNIPKKYQQGVKPLKELKTMSEIKKAIGEMQNFMLGDRSTYSGFIKSEKFKKKLFESKMGRKMTNEEYIQFTNFLRDAQARLKDIWKFVSDDAIELYDESQRLNLNPMQLIKNFDYWKEHLDQLKNAKPINRKNVKPSDYVKQLKLPKIRTWNDQNR